MRYFLAVWITLRSCAESKQYLTVHNCSLELHFLFVHIQCQLIRPLLAALQSSVTAFHAAVVGISLSN